MNIGDTFSPYRLFTGAMTPNWLMQRNEISCGAKLCYARLAQYSGQNGRCFPRQATLALEMGCVERQVRRYLAELEQHNLIETNQPGLQKPNSYQFLWHEWIECMSDNDRTTSSGHDGTDVSGPTGLRESVELNQIRSTPLPPYQGEEFLQLSGEVPSRDEAAEFVERFRGEFDHYDPIGDAKVKKEKTSARTIIKKGIAEDVIHIVHRALLEEFPGRKAWVGTLSAIVSHWSELKALYATNSSGGSTNGASEDDEPLYCTTAEQVYRNRKNYIAACEEVGTTPKPLPKEYIAMLRADMPEALEEFGLEKGNL